MKPWQWAVAIVVGVPAYVMLWKLGVAFQKWYLGL